MLYLRKQTTLFVLMPSVIRLLFVYVLVSYHFAYVKIPFDCHIRQVWLYEQNNADVSIFELI